MFFYFNKIINRGNREVEVTEGSHVKVVVNLKTREKPAAWYILVEEEKKKKVKKEDKQNKTERWSK